MLALPPSAFAKKPPEKVGPFKECPFEDWPARCVFVGVEEGKPAPITGDLFSVDYATWLNLEVNDIDSRIEAAVTATAASYKEDLKFQRTSFEADAEATEKIHKAEKRVLEAQIPSWYERTAPVMILTALVTATIVTVIYVGTAPAQRLRDELAGVR